jgi:mycofactocin precursor
MSAAAGDVTHVTERYAPDMENTTVTEEREAQDLVEEELLVEEISIDGMCGVY